VGTTAAATAAQQQQQYRAIPTGKPVSRTHTGSPTKATRIALPAIRLSNCEQIEMHMGEEAGNVDQ
jgi:hypothetical protein